MDTHTTRQKPGPRPKGTIKQQCILPVDLAEWAKDQPEGYSALVRRLLQDERARRMAAAAR